MLSKIASVTCNPANIRYNSHNKWLGLVGEYKGFCQFVDFVYGVRALIVTLRTYLRQGHDSVPLIISRYAPSNENNTPAYIDYVRDYLDEHNCYSEIITLESIDFYYLCRAICLYESSYDLSLTEYNYVRQRFNL